ncbi:uncharacterized protein LOC26526616 [Drosophila erecta]|uniref:Uncharacterized protein n=1 Tax=Drosophila erecta TaxID=7220 RepID=A0A0Q5WAL9_DROER|nr:uncharacterized protein LOC26526616 [Drosophila erecta]KQS70483.1 uncharacterized protein Dere_GG26792 [Drosophila erecta]
MSDQPGDGDVRLRLKVRQCVYGIAMVYIVLAIGLIILPGLFKRYSLVPDVVATYCFFVIGLASLCTYVNVTWLRRKFPFNWIVSCCSAACLALGTVSILSSQRAAHVLLVSLEILVMMALLLLVGSFLLADCPTIAYLFLTWFIFVVFSCVLMAAVCVHVPDLIYSYEVATHFVLWQVMCPLIVFQAQVISGYWENLPPILDMPLCSTMLLLDFLACYIFLDSADEVGFEFYYAGQTSNQKFLARSLKSQWDMFVDSK